MGVVPPGTGCRGISLERPTLELADVVRAFGERLETQHPLSPDQARTLRAIASCRTAVLGGHLDVCLDCGFERPAYNSCRNRHCPKCQGLAQAAWLERRLDRLLPVNYFHVVFTLPEQLRPLALNNQRLVYRLLFQTAAETLLELAHSRLDALLGFTAVLHTWTQELAFHPHLHCIVTGGGLSNDGLAWAAVRSGRFLFPVKVMSRLFRGKFLAGLRALQRDDRLRHAGTAAPHADPQVFARLLDELYRKEWVVYAKKPFGGAEQVYRYLGRYTHRVGISNQRLVAMDAEKVRFARKDGSVLDLPGVAFLRRLILHVLPAGFVKIRHYGLLAPANVPTRFDRARELLATPTPTSTQHLDYAERYLALTGVDLLRCPRCGVRPLAFVALAAARPARDPPP